MLPCYPSGDSKGDYSYTIVTYWRKLVADYARLSLPEVGRLDYLQYLTMRRDAYIYRLEQTEPGREYLANAWRMEQTEPDRAALRRKIGRRARSGNE